MTSTSLRTGGMLAAGAVVLAAITGGTGTGRPRHGRAAAPAVSRGTPIGYQVLRRDVILNADVWNTRPEMMAAGLGVTSIIGGPGLSTGYRR